MKIHEFHDLTAKNADWIFKEVERWYSGVNGYFSVTKITASGADVFYAQIPDGIGVKINHQKQNLIVRYRWVSGKLLEDIVPFNQARLVFSYNLLQIIWEDKDGAKIILTLVK